MYEMSAFFNFFFEISKNQNAEKIRHHQKHQKSKLYMYPELCRKFEGISLRNKKVTADLPRGEKCALLPPPLIRFASWRFKDPAHLLRPLSGERKIRFSKNACMCMVCGCTLVFENYFWWKNIHIDYHNHIYAISSSQITQITLNSMWFYVKFRVKLFWHIRWVVTSQSTWTSLESTKIRNSYHGITLLPQIWKISSLWISHRIT